MKKRLLYLTRFFDPEISSGLTNRFLKTLDELCNRFDVYVVLFVSEPNEYEKFRGYFGSKSINIIAIEISRMKKVKESFKTFLIGTNFYELYYTKEIRDFLVDYIATNNIDILYANYFYLTPIFMEPASKSLVKVVDLVDSVSLHMREAEGISLARRAFYGRVKNSVLSMELKAIENANVVFITTEKEKEYFSGKINTTHLEKIHVLWNGVEAYMFNVGEQRLAQIENKEFQLNNRIAFLGSLDYYPNNLAAIRLVSKIFPRLLARKPELELYIVGRNPSQELRNLCLRNDRVKLLGYVENIDEVLLNVDMLVLPMTIASGIQNKLLTGLCSAMPVIISSRAFFSKELVNFVNVISAESDDEYINNILLLYQDVAKVMEISKNSYNFAKSKLQWPAILKRYTEIIQNML